MKNGSGSGVWNSAIGRGICKDMQSICKDPEVGKFFDLFKKLNRDHINEAKISVSGA